MNADVLGAGLPQVFYHKGHLAANFNHETHETLETYLLQGFTAKTSTCAYTQTGQDRQGDFGAYAPLRCQRGMDFLPQRSQSAQSFFWAGAPLGLHKNCV